MPRFSPEEQIEVWECLASGQPMKTLPWSGWSLTPGRFFLEHPKHSDVTLTAASNLNLSFERDALRRVGGRGEAHGYCKPIGYVTTMWLHVRIRGGSNER